MPWRREELETQRGRFVLRAIEEDSNIAELCREAGISRVTAYKWIKRYRKGGIATLRDENRRPKKFGKETTRDIVMEVVRVRTEHPTWGGKKIRGYILRRKLFKKVPVGRTIDRILKRCGLVSPRITRKRRELPEVKIVRPIASNDVWTIDFKGWWLMQDGTRCEPLTIRDEYSRFIIGIFALSTTTFEAVKTCLIECFKQYGLPKYIRSDNGHPFISVQSLCGLTRLSVWWLRLGITPNRIEVASPSMNGAHERMHLDMKRELQINPAQNLKAEQKRFDEWRYDFNNFRPHAALKDDAPVDWYKRSARQYSQQRGPHKYPLGFVTRKVSRNGEISWHGKWVGISKAFAREEVGIEILDSKHLRLWYTDFCLGVSDVDFKTRLVHATSPLKKENLPEAA